MNNKILDKEDYKVFARHCVDKAMSKIRGDFGTSVLQEATDTDLRIACVIANALLDDDVSGVGLDLMRYEDKLSITEICEKVESESSCWETVTAVDVMAEVTSRCPKNGVVWVRTDAIKRELYGAIRDECSKRGVEVDARYLVSRGIIVHGSTVRVSTLQKQYEVEPFKFNWSLGRTDCGMHVKTLE